MSVTAPPSVKAPKPPKDVTERLDRGRRRNGALTGKRNEAWNFWRGDQYCYVANAGYVVQQSTITAVDGEGKPRHRMRLVRNELLDSVEHEVAAATSRIPSYQVNPSTIDPADISAAHLSEKIARYGYDAWRLREIREQIVTSAIVAGEGFGWPYWDQTIGPLVDPETGACEGEVSVRLFTANEVYWEPGVRFETSRWHAIDQARPLDEVKALPNFIGATLTPDATTGETINQRAKPQVDQLVMVTEYLERPSAAWPRGRRLTMANGKVILPPETYPCVDGRGEPVDEPVLHKLSRIIDPDSDRDMGLVRHGLDAQRTINDCVSKESEWKNLALNPQILAPIGALVRRLTDEPGAVVEYRPIGGVAPQWRPVPPIPGELQRMREEAAGYIRRLFAQNDIPSQVSAARAIQAVIERDENRRAAFVARLADFDSRLMRHCLYLVQRYYTERRLVKIRGRFGWESIPDFKGTDLRGQADVVVMPASIEPRTKESISQTVMNYAQLGWVDRNEAMFAIENGTAESLIEDYELDVAKANRQIRRIEALGAGLPGGDVPIADPEFDNPAVMIHVLSQFAKTPEFEQLSAPAQEATKLLVQQYRQIQATRDQQAAQQQALQASQMGQGNASRPPANGGKPLPSLPSVQSPPQGSQ